MDAKDIERELLAIRDRSKRLARRAPVELRETLEEFVACVEDVVEVVAVHIPDDPDDDDDPEEDDDQAAA